MPRVSPPADPSQPERTSMDLPLITEATNDYYRNIYADPDLGPIFKGINMVVLRTHVSYFINQVAMFDAPMSTRQLEYLRKVHEPIIQQHSVTQRHYDIMLRYLVEAMRANGAEETNLESVQQKLLPLRNIFPPAQLSEDGHVLVQETSSEQPGAQQDHAPAKPVQADTTAAACDTTATCGTTPACGTPAAAAADHKPSWIQRVLKPACCYSAGKMEA